jgi:Predicted phosphoesterase or phosphohydrolase
MSTPRFIADTHLGHRNIYKYRQVFDSTKHNDLYFIRVLQETCTKRDIMYFLGDICFDRFYLDMIKELPGSKNPNCRKSLHRVHSNERTSERL